MKELIIKIISLSATSVVLANCLLFVMLFHNDRMSVVSHEMNVKLAHDKLDSLKTERKIVIVAGSNGGFGVNSKMIEDSLSLATINTSTHAGIGVRMQFELVKEFLHDDDILVFCPEYYAGKSSFYGESSLLRIIGTHLPSSYNKFSCSQWLYMYKYFGVHFQECCEHGVWGLLRGRLDGPYSFDAVDKYGDIVYKRAHEQLVGVYRFQESLDDEVLDYYKYIYSFCKVKGVKMLHLPPTLCESVYQDQCKQIESLASFMRNNEVPYLSNPERYSYSDTLYYDTPYHMTTEGATLRTSDLIEDIKQFFFT